MNFEELHKPYADQDSPTVEGQMRWLLKQGIPQHLVDLAMLYVYDQITKGKTFSGGRELDLYLLDIARKLHADEIIERLKILQERYGNIAENKKDSLLVRIKKVFRP